MQRPAFDSKHPNAKSRIGIDWTDFIDDPVVTISQSVWAATGTSGVTFSGGTTIGQQTFTRVDGGADGTWAYITNTATMSDGRVGVFLINMRISDMLA